MTALLQPGATVRVLPPFSGSDLPSEPTTVAAVQWVTPDGLISDEPQADFQYLLDGDEPFADTAFRPEHVEEVD